MGKVEKEDMRAERSLDKTLKSGKRRIVAAGVDHETGPKISLLNIQFVKFLILVYMICLKFV